jgi:hypothetical protein
MKFHNIYFRNIVIIQTNVFNFLIWQILKFIFINIFKGNIILLTYFNLKNILFYRNDLFIVTIF